MLIKFVFKNFKSFKDEATINLAASKISEYSEHLFCFANDKILPVLAIYGANASGKSSVYQAFEYMSEYVANSFKYGGDEDSKEKSEFEYMKPTPFLFSKTNRESESHFEVFFNDVGGETTKTHNYGFTVNLQGVTKEWLNSKAKTARHYKRVFYRDIESGLDLSGIAAKYRENIEVSLEKETLIISLGAKLKMPKLKAIRDWFLKNEFADFGDPVQSFFLSRMLPSGFVEESDVQNDVVRFLSSFDNSIKGFTIEKVPSSDSDKKDDRYMIDTIHSMIDSDETTSIPLSLESDGTLKMFALYPSLQSALEKGSVLFVDELNARLHPLLVKNFIGTFLNPATNPHRAQLIFTTHDTWQLATDMLRRDEIWFAEKDKDGASTIYSLADCVDDDGVKIRKDENYEKSYLNGKYNAVPRIASFDIRIAQTGAEKDES